MNRLEQIMDEVEAGINKLDKGDLWISNSCWVSLLILSLFLLSLSVCYVFISIYMTVKWSIVKKYLRR